MMLSEFLEAAMEAGHDGNPAEAAAALMAGVLQDPAEVAEWFEPNSFNFMVHTHRITVCQGEAPALLAAPAHSHGVWAAIGVYRGVEESIVYEESPDGQLREVDRYQLRAGEWRLLPHDLIHAVRNPDPTVPNGWLNIYGGPFFDVVRREWDESGTACARRLPSSRVLETLRRTLVVGHMPDAAPASS